MLKWKTEVPEPRALRSEMNYKNLTLSISPANHHGHPDELWQWISLSLGEHREASMGACQETWPKEAIALARKLLDEFEDKIVFDDVTEVAREVGDVRNYLEK